MGQYRPIILADWRIGRTLIRTHLLDATQRSQCASEAWMRSTERRCWSGCCQSQSADVPHLSWWPDCEQRIHLQGGTNPGHSRSNCLKNFQVFDKFVAGFTSCDDAFSSHQSALRSWRWGWRRRRRRASSWPNAWCPFQLLTSCASPGRAAQAATGHPHWRHHLHSTLRQSQNISPLKRSSWERTELWLLS